MTNEFDAPGTYDAAAADYDLTSVRFWAFVSERTVGRLDLARGALVLDVPCAPGRDSDPLTPQQVPEGPLSPPTTVIPTGASLFGIAFGKGDSHNYIIGCIRNGANRKYAYNSNN
jgi:hypothetical protein